MPIRASCLGVYPGDLLAAHRAWPSETPTAWNILFQGTQVRRGDPPAEAAAQAPIDCVDRTVFAKVGTASTTPYDVNGLPCEMAET